MSEQSETKSDLRRIAECLDYYGVEFIVIGGQAETLYGSPRVTYDVDLCYRRTKENLERLATALNELKPKLRGAPPDLPFVIDVRTLSLGTNFTFTTRDIPLDLLGWVEPLGDYDALAKRAKPRKLGNNDVLVIDLDDLITIKQHIRRPKDQESLMQLLAIKRTREETGRE
jgi:predicted nucleotidyltransferase